MKISLPDNIEHAIRRLLEYSYEDEREHYEQSLPEDRKNHVFLSLEELRTWLDGE